MSPATKPAPEPVPVGVCHHCFARAVARRRFSVDKRTILLCEDRCAPRWERFVTAIATRRGEAVDVEQDDAPTVIEVSRGRARMPAHDSTKTRGARPAAPAADETEGPTGLAGAREPEGTPEGPAAPPKAAVGQRDLFGGGA